jgi:hypothetical protein
MKQALNVNIRKSLNMDEVERVAAVRIKTKATATDLSNKGLLRCARLHAILSQTFSCPGEKQTQ